MNIRHTLTTVTAAGVMFAPSFATAGRDDHETPDYKVVKNDGAFEVRDYPAILVATTQMKKEGGNRNSAFMRLFRYISGKNQAEQKIQMTTPVITSKAGGKTAMSFVVPKEVAKAGAPPPNDPDIVIEKRSAGRFAVYRYSGRWTEARESAARAKLMAWAKEQGLTVKGNVDKANYDPPFTLPALRRNEVMVRIGK